MTDDLIYGAGNGLVYLGAAIQPDVLFKWIQLGLGILMTVIGIAYRVWVWYKKAKEDGKITGEEVKQLIDENKDAVVEVIEKTVDLAEDIKDNKEK
ncbi:MAG: hypothetical protein MJZ37_08845 [Bacilli bacterium]|nr:hypothetical protein [Bacilli bacterium]